MSQLEEGGVEAFDLDDRCIVPWKDGSIYAGKVQRILDPENDVVIQGSPMRKDGKVTLAEDATPIDKLKSSRQQRVPADVLESSRESGEKWYFVHYFGWKTNYDEWLPPHRMLPHTPRNINEMKRVNAEIKERAKQQKLAEARESKLKKTKKRAPSESKEASPAADPKPAKRRNTGKQASPARLKHEEPAPEAVAGRPRRRVVMHDGPGLEIRLAVPLELKRLLVKDWQLVTHNREIVKLPRPICVVEILKDFANASAPQSNSGDRENMDHFVQSMTVYFDYAFGMMLLYRFERNQYYGQRKNNDSFRPSLIYGAEHLARLIVSMPTLLSQLAAMDDVTMGYIVGQLEKLSAFLADHRVRYFAGEQSYDSATRVYEAVSIPNMVAEPAAPAEQVPSSQAASDVDDAE